jgi:hypothetical protein
MRARESEFLPESDSYPRLPENPVVGILRFALTGENVPALKIPSK